MIPFILFKLGNDSFAIPFDEIDEIQNGKKGTPLPFSEPWHEGMITIRGELYTVLNIGKKLGLQTNEAIDQGKNILLNRYKAVLLVDELEHTITASEEAISDNEDADAMMRHMFPTVIANGAESVPVLSVDVFIASTKVE